jgi:hypothetical protein
MRQRRRRNHEILFAVGNAAVILAPRHLAGIGRQIRAAQPFFKSVLGDYAATALVSLPALFSCSPPFLRNRDHAEGSERGTGWPGARSTARLRWTTRAVGLLA